MRKKVGWSRSCNPGNGCVKFPKDFCRTKAFRAVFLTCSILEWDKLRKFRGRQCERGSDKGRGGVKYEMIIYRCPPVPQLLHIGFSDPQLYEVFLIQEHVPKMYLLYPLYHKCTLNFN